MSSENPPQKRASRRKSNKPRQKKDDESIFKLNTFFRIMKSDLFKSYTDNQLYTDHKKKIDELTKPIKMSKDVKKHVAYNDVINELLLCLVHQKREVIEKGKDMDSFRVNFGVSDIKTIETKLININPDFSKVFDLVNGFAHDAFKKRETKNFEEAYTIFSLVSGSRLKEALKELIKEEYGLTFVPKKTNSNSSKRGSKGKDAKMSKVKQDGLTGFTISFKYDDKELKDEDNDVTFTGMFSVLAFAVIYYLIETANVCRHIHYDQADNTIYASHESNRNIEQGDLNEAILISGFGELHSLKNKLISVMGESMINSLSPFIVKHDPFAIFNDNVKPRKSSRRSSYGSVSSTSEDKPKRKQRSDKGKKKSRKSNSRSRSRSTSRTTSSQKKKQEEKKEEKKQAKGKAKKGSRSRSRSTSRSRSSQKGEKEEKKQANSRSNSRSTSRTRSSQKKKVASSGKKQRAPYGSKKQKGSSKSKPKNAKKAAEMTEAHDTTTIEFLDDENYIPASGSRSRSRSTSRSGPGYEPRSASRSSSRSSSKKKE